MELLFKIAVTAVIIVFIYWQILFLKWLWPTQIDAKATFSKFIKQKTQKTTIIATRDPNKIYQDGNPVGDITGKIEEKDDLIIFTQIINTSSLKRDVPFEHKRDKYQIIKIETSIGIKMEATNSGIEPRNAVIENVVCKKIRQ